MIRITHHGTFFDDKIIDYVYDHLPHSKFIKISRECVININFVKKIKSGYIELSDGENIHIPHGKIREIKNKLKQLLQWN